MTQRPVTVPGGVGHGPMFLTAQYLKDHVANAKDKGKGDANAYEEFGRNIASALMEAASKSPTVSSDSKPESVEVSPISATLKQMQPRLCVDVTVTVAGIPVTAHVGVG